MKLRSTIPWSSILTLALMLAVAACVESPDTTYEFALMGDNEPPRVYRRLFDLSHAPTDWAS